MWRDWSAVIFSFCPKISPLHDQAHSLTPFFFYCPGLLFKTGNQPIRERRIKGHFTGARTALCSRTGSCACWNVAPLKSLRCCLSVRVYWRGSGGIYEVFESSGFTGKTIIVFPAPTSPPVAASVSRKSSSLLIHSTLLNKSNRQCVLVSESVRAFLFISHSWVT